MGTPSCIPVTHPQRFEHGCVPHAVSLTHSTYLPILPFSRLFCDDDRFSESCSESIRKSWTFTQSPEWKRLPQLQHDTNTGPWTLERAQS